MKKFLLSAALLGGVLGAEAQEMLSANFEADQEYTIGDFTKGLISGSTQGYDAQGIFYGYAYEATVPSQMIPARYQVELGTATNTTQVLRMTGWPLAVGEATKSNIVYAYFGDAWSGNETATPAVAKTRLDGNDILELDFDLFIPAASTSKNSLRVRIANNSSQYVVATNYVADTNALTALISTATNGTSTIAGSSNTTLPRSSWQHVTVTYNTISGEIKQRYGNTLVTSTTLNLQTPAYIELLLRSNSPTTVATPAAEFKIDNITITATSTSTLGTKEIYRENNDVAVYLNHNQLEVSSKIAVEALEVYNLAGQLQASQANSNSIDVSALGKGTYVAKYSDKKQTYSKRFIK